MRSSDMKYDAVAASIAKISGFLVPGQEQWLFEKVKSLPDDAVIVEIGSLYGRSSCAMGFACVGTRRRVFCIDPWKYAELGDLDFFDRWRANVAANRLEPHLMPLRGRSHDVLGRWSQLTGGLPIDFIFIDGWHEYASVLRDFELAFPLVKMGGWIALHDVCAEWPGPSRVWEQTAGPSLSHHERCSTIACGRKHRSRIEGIRGVPAAAPVRSALHVHFFTELWASDGLSNQLATLRQLEFPWRWHLMTNRPSLQTQAIARQEQRVSVHSIDSDNASPNRVEALSSLLREIPDECILWRIDLGDAWSADQLAAGTEMLLDNPQKTALSVHTPAGPRAVAWHWHPWFRWTNAAEPFLAAFLADGTVIDVGSANPMVIDAATFVEQRLCRTCRSAA